MRDNTHELKEQFERLKRLRSEKTRIEARFNGTAFPAPGECKELDEICCAYFKAQREYREDRARAGCGPDAIARRG